MLHSSSVEHETELEVGDASVFAAGYTMYMQPYVNISPAPYFSHHAYPPCGKGL